MRFDVGKEGLVARPRLYVIKYIVNNVEYVQPPSLRGWSDLFLSSSRLSRLKGVGVGQQIFGQGRRPGARGSQMLQQPLLALL